MSLYPIITAIKHPRITLLGAREFRSGFGMTYDDTRTDAYDIGREAAHILTFRRYEC